MDGSRWISWSMVWVLLGILTVNGSFSNHPFKPEDLSPAYPLVVELQPGLCPRAGGEVPRIQPLAALGEFETLIRQYLDALDTPWGLAELINLQKITVAGQEKHYRSWTTWQDLTGDGVAEVVLWLYHPESDSNNLLVFGCKDGMYKTIFKKTPYAALITVKDMNRNGLPEVVFSERDCTVGCLTYYFLMEWDGDRFANQGQVSEPPCYGPCTFTGSAQVKDLNRDGWYELEIVDEPSPINGPGRSQIQIWAWDGNFYSLLERKYAESKYRIHVLYAGDDAAAAGLYDKAWDYYQRVIYDPGLLPARNWAPNTLPDWDSAETLEERQVLSAYARYRIMHLFLAQDLVSDAGVVYGYLQLKFPPDVIGHVYAEMATLLWEGYRTSASLAAACTGVIVYVEAHLPETLAVLGTDVYGANNRDYQPKDICPEFSK
jgi:hypothetical protein